MPKRLTAQDKLDRFKTKVTKSAFSDFFLLYNEFKEIEEDILNEEKERWNNER